MEKYDIIIIGAGLSGLYSAYNIKKMSPKTTFLILESNRKQYIGGRIGNETFYNTQIVVGAGVGRKDTDKSLIQLLKELHIHTKDFTVNMNYSFLNYDKELTIKKILYHLRQVYNNYKEKPTLTFKQFASQHLGNKLYKQFVTTAGYSDYEKEDVYEVLYHYQMEDNGPGWTGIEIPWSELVHALCKKIGLSHIKTSCAVENIVRVKTEPSCLYEISTNKGVKYYANKVIVATRISTTQKLFPKEPIYREIHGQPFLYVYAKFDKESAEIMKQCVPFYTIVPGPLQKIVPMDSEKGVYMIAYTDNKNADYLKDYAEANNTHSKSYFEEELERVLQLPKNALHIIALKSFYWPIGTHYYSPLNFKKYANREEFIWKAQHPEPCILVVGEAVSRRQGWTEGALESVEKVLNMEWVKT
jgi:hypothetical protein